MRSDRVETIEFFAPPMADGISILLDNINMKKGGKRERKRENRGIGAEVPCVGTDGAR
jgi:hypothetical protein